MKRILFITILFTTILSFSQDKFNFIYDSLGARTSRNIVIQENNYYTLGGNSPLGILGIVPSKFDLNGNFIESKFYADTMTWYHGAENCLKETGTGYYILGAQRKKNWYNDNLIIKFDQNFDTIFTKKYYAVDDSGYKTVLLYGSSITKDTNYIFIGITNIDNNYDSLYQPQMQLIKTDTLGDLLWRKTYGNDTVKHYGYKVVNTFDGGYLLGGWAYSTANNGDWAIVKVDENGENPIFKYFGNPNYDDGRIMGITPTKDSCYLVAGGKGIGYSAGYTTFKAWLIKIDKDLNIIWEKQYLKPCPIAFFYEALEKENDNLNVYGGNQNDEAYKMSVIMELTSDGDSIWKQVTTANNEQTLDNNLESCKLTPDGGMIFGGYTYDPQLSPPQQMWLVKTDSMGCDGTEWTCDISYLEELTSKEENGLRVYPNPTKSTLFVELNSTVIARKNDEAIPSTKQIASSTAFPRNDELTKAQFQELPIDQKLKYSSKNPNNTLWGKAEEQEMRELSRKLAYAFPFEVIRGEVDIFTIDPVLAMRVESENHNTKLTAGSSLLEKRVRKIDNSEQEITIYDIQGRLVKKETLDIRQKTLEINVSSLQNGVYFVQVGESVAKFVKE